MSKGILHCKQSIAWVEWTSKNTGKITGCHRGGKPLTTKNIKEKNMIKAFCRSYLNMNVKKWNSTGNISTITLTISKQ